MSSASTRLLEQLGLARYVVGPPVQAQRLDPFFASIDAWLFHDTTFFHLQAYPQVRHYYSLQEKSLPQDRVRIA